MRQWKTDIIEHWCIHLTSTRTPWWTLRHIALSCVSCVCWVETELHELHICCLIYFLVAQRNAGAKNGVSTSRDVGALRCVKIIALSCCVGVFKPTYICKGLFCLYILSHFSWNFICMVCLFVAWWCCSKSERLSRLCGVGQSETRWNAGARPVVAHGYVKGSWQS